MKRLLGVPRRSSLPRDLAGATVPAIRSTLVITTVALVAFAFRVGGFKFAKIKSVAEENWSLFLLVFAGIFVWEYWHQRAKRNRAK
jgi:hypothetical protein